MIDSIKKFIKIFRKLEEYLLVFFVAIMVIVAFAQLALKVFFGSGVEWFSPLLKYSVLWTGMIAAGIATYENKHIKIDIVGKFARGKLKKFVNILTALFAGSVSLLLAIISWIYIVKIEYTATDTPPILNIPRWVLLLIMPAGFGLMSIRFYVNAFFAKDDSDTELDELYKNNDKVINE